MAIVFIHEGYSSYLEFTLRQARHASPEAEIVLLGNADNDRFPFVTHVDIGEARYQKAGAEIERVYRHMATNPKATALRWLQRWFWLRTFLLERKDLAAVWVLDSDVMLYASDTELTATFAEGDGLSLALPAEQDVFEWSAGPHASFWTRERVTDFCAFALNSYTEPDALAQYEAKWAHHQQTGTPGGVCDMTTLYLFAANQPFTNVSTVRDGVAFDHNFNSALNEWPSEYKMRRGHKALTWDAERRPWGENIRLGHPVRFLGLHLQGSAKGLIPSVYNGPAFFRRKPLAAQMRRYFWARSLAGRVKTGLWRLGAIARGSTGAGS